MRKEPLTMVRAAPRRDRHLRNAEVARLPYQDRPQIDMLLSRFAKALGDLGTDLVALPTNPDPAMHYDVVSTRERMALEDFDAALQHGRRHPAPPRVQEGDGALLRHREVNRNAVRNRDGEQHALGTGRMPVHAFEQQPAVRTVLLPAHRRAVHLMSGHQRGERALERGMERAPASHNLSDIVLAPQPQTEPMPADRDAGNEAVTIRPLCEGQPGNGRISDGLLGESWRVGG